MFLSRSHFICILWEVFLNFPNRNGRPPTSASYIAWNLMKFQSLSPQLLGITAGTAVQCHFSLTSLGRRNTLWRCSVSLRGGHNSECFGSIASAPNIIVKPALGHGWSFVMYSGMFFTCRNIWLNFRPWPESLRFQVQNRVALHLGICSGSGALKIAEGPHRLRIPPVIFDHFFWDFWLSQ